MHSRRLTRLQFVGFFVKLFHALHLALLATIEMKLRLWAILWRPNLLIAQESVVLIRLTFDGMIVTC